MAACCSTPVERPASTAKFHTALNVSDLGRSVAFYRLLLGLEPAKQRPDYAKFELDDPPLVLSLIPGRPAPGGSVNHFGLRVADSDALVEIQRRLELGGIKTTREEGVECCYARQTKFWVADPDHVLWEVYVFHEDIEEAGEGKVPAIETLQDGAAPSVPAKVTWRHAIGEPVPASIPCDENSVHEVFLEGTANLRATEQFRALLQEIRRVLRPGGSVRIHGLSGDAPLADALPPLPGPAAVVERVPSHGELVGTLQEAGFASIQVQQLSQTTHFKVGEVGLREIVITARKPGFRPAVKASTAIYLGPLAEVRDDLGNVFPRGVPVPLNVHDRQALSESAIAGSFLFP